MMQCRQVVKFVMASVVIMAVLVGPALNWTKFPSCCGGASTSDGMAAVMVPALAEAAVLA